MPQNFDWTARMNDEVGRERNNNDRMDVSPINARGVEAYDEVSDAFLSAWDPEGDKGRKYLLNPTIFRLLGPLENQRILDAGCGQGYLSRLMASVGADVTGIEPAGRLIAYARRSEQERPLGIQYLQRDLSRLGAIHNDGQFDAVVANMVFLDIADWQAAMSNCLEVLSPGGHLIFSLHHPCWTPNASNSWADYRRVELTEYLQSYEMQMPIGVNYHRPLSDYLNYALKLGASIEEIAEPTYPADLSDDELPDVGRHIPEFVVVKMSSKVPGHA
jgi:2-polyprenyl-3-methyl-5-hydroxy-6-metoxy-1,4-benzoquinol methylase